MNVGLCVISVQNHTIEGGVGTTNLETRSDNIYSVFTILRYQNRNPESTNLQKKKYEE